MSDPLRSLVEYEHFVHTLTQQFPAVRRSTVTFVRRGATLARVAGVEELIQDSQRFREVCAEGGTVVWSNGADLCPDVLIWGGPPPLTAEQVPASLPAPGPHA